MESLLETVNRVLGLFWLGNCYWSIAVISLLSAVLFLFIFKKSSNQEKIRMHKKRVMGNILEMVIYKDQIWVMARSITRILGHNMLYFLYTLPPLAIIVLPLALISMQINNRCGYRSFQPGESFIFRAELDPKAVAVSHEEFLSKLACETGNRTRLDTLPLRIPEEGTIEWRVRVREDASPGIETLRILVSDKSQVAERRVALGGAPSISSPEKVKWAWSKGLIHNAEGFLPRQSPFRTISVKYERAVYPFLLWETDALVVYFILTMVFALALKPFFKVAI